MKARPKRPGRRNAQRDPLLLGVLAEVRRAGAASKRGARGEAETESLGLGDDAVQSLIRWYCREAGVRNLSKQVDKVYRKLALKVVRDADVDDISWEVDEDGLADMLGKPPFTT